MEGRKSASSVVILLTDGKPSFQFSTKKAAQELRDSGVRVVRRRGCNTVANVA